jgi:hypothetical protein
MSKKLIAVAAAAALALTGLVATTPAYASYTFGVTVDGEVSGGNGLTADTPAVINVPSQDALRYGVTAGTASDSVVRLNVQASTTSAAVRVTVTGGVKVMTEANFSVTANRKIASGVTTLDLTSSASDGTVGFYAFNTSTTAGTVVVTQGGNSRTVYIKGANAAGYAYNVNFTAPATADVSDSIVVTGTVTDAFGNVITGLTALQGLTGSYLGAASALSADATEDWEESTTTPGTYTFAVTTGATAGTGVIGIKITTAPTKITTLGTPKDSMFVTFSTASLADQVTALTASVAALKADYNALAAKWNKRVASKTAPKKKVALK